MFPRGLPILFLLAVPASAGAQSDFTKVIPGVRTVELARELPGYAFYTVQEEPVPTVPDQPPPIPAYRATRIELVPKVKRAVPGDLYVVPESAAKEKGDDKALGFALAKSQIAGAHTVPPVYAQEVPTEDPRTELRVHIVIQSVDPNGLIYDRTSNDPDDPHNLIPPQGQNAGGGAKPKAGPSWVLIGIVALVVVAGAAVAVVVLVLKFTRRKSDEAEDEEDEDDEE